MLIAKQHFSDHKSRLACFLAFKNRNHSNTSGKYMSWSSTLACYLLMQYSEWVSSDPQMERVTDPTSAYTLCTTNREAYDDGPPKGNTFMMSCTITFHCPLTAPHPPFCPRGNLQNQDSTVRGEKNKGQSISVRWCGTWFFGHSGLLPIESS